LRRRPRPKLDCGAKENRIFQKYNKNYYQIKTLSAQPLRRRPNGENFKVNTAPPIITELSDFV
jgi:hypothetical protein